MSTCKPFQKTFAAIAVFLLSFCLACPAQAVRVKMLPGLPPQGTRFPLVYYLIDNGMGISLSLKYREMDATKELDTYPIDKLRSADLAEHRRNGVHLPLYLGYITVEADYTITFIAAPGEGSGATGAGTYVKIFLDGYDKAPLAVVPNAENTAVVKRQSWNGVLFILDALKKNGTLAAIYKTSGLPPDPTFQPEFAKTTIVLLDVLRSVTFTPPYDAFDARISNPLPGMTLEFLARPNAP